MPVVGGVWIGVFQDALGLLMTISLLLVLHAATASSAAAATAAAATGWLMMFHNYFLILIKRIHADAAPTYLQSLANFLWKKNA